MEKIGVEVFPPFKTFYKLTFFCHVFPSRFAFLTHDSSDVLIIV